MQSRRLSVNGKSARSRSGLRGHESKQRSTHFSNRIHSLYLTSRLQAWPYDRFVGVTICCCVTMGTAFRRQNGILSGQSLLRQGARRTATRTRIIFIKLPAGRKLPSEYLSHGRARAVVDPLAAAGGGHLGPGRGRCSLLQVSVEFGWFFFNY